MTEYEQYMLDKYATEYELVDRIRELLENRYRAFFDSIFAKDYTANPEELFEIIQAVPDPVMRAFLLDKYDVTTGRFAKTSDGKPV